MARHARRGDGAGHGNCGGGPIAGPHCRVLLTFEVLYSLYHHLAYSGKNSYGARNSTDMRALSAMISYGGGSLYLFCNKRIMGPVLGVFISDVLSYRAELIVVGLDNHT